MDITRNWRLKTSRSQLIAARLPESSAVTLPQQSAVRPTQTPALYTFETEEAQVQISEAGAEYAKAAR